MLTGIIQRKFIDNVAENRRINAASVKSLAKEGAKLVVLSELHDSPYFCQCENVDNFGRYATPIEEFSHFYSEVARINKVVLVTSAFEKRAPGLYHNTALVYDSDGSLAGKYRKMHIPDDPGFYEKFYFTPGDLGFNPIPTSVGKLGVLVCWDQWYPEAARLMAMRGAEMLIYPTAIGWNPEDPRDEQMRQRDAWITIQRSHAVANGIPVVSVNRVGFEPDPTHATAGIDFWGSSFVCGPQGEIINMASELNEENILIDIDLKRSENVRHWWPFLRDRRIDHYGPITERFLD